MTAAQDGDLLTAARNRAYTRVRDLLNEGADVNAQDPDTGRTVLHEIVSGEATDFVRRRLMEAVLAHDPDVNIQDKQGYSPFHAAVEWALKEGKQEYMKQLLDNGANSLLRDAQGRTALDIAREREGFANYYASVISFLEIWEQQKSPLKRAQEHEAATFDAQHEAAGKAQERLRRQSRKGPKLKL